jgi:hypothetical protein
MALNLSGSRDVHTLYEGFMRLGAGGASGNMEARASGVGSVHPHHRKTNAAIGLWFMVG